MKRNVGGDMKRFVSPQQSSYQLNTPPRPPGSTVMENEPRPLPERSPPCAAGPQVMETGLLTVNERGDVRTTSVAGSETPTTSIGRSAETWYALPTRILTSFVSPPRSMKRGSG